ncbi:ADP-ribosylation factor 2-B [Morella rubra]|uniref:ADP-ribosylation factor 2-B n=1 Tax=Morella rubra TaxID=262757 RepID=A0A6A1WQJ0_9ROSI|nr:ADP-ribosylation factor 2-B [Morella rubra]
MTEIIVELVPLIEEAMVEAGAAVVEGTAVEGAVVEGAAVECVAVEAVEGAAVEGAAVEVAAKGPANALRDFAAKALTDFTTGVATGAGFIVGTEVLKMLKNKILGLPVETVESDGVKLITLDVGEKDKEPHFCDHAEYCVIFVVDSNDRDRISEAREELHRMLGEDNLRGKPLLVLANKDIPNAMSTSEITAKLGLTPLIQRPWHVQATCATSGGGLNEGFSWLIKNI